MWLSFSPEKQQPDISCLAITVDFLMINLGVLKNPVILTICHPGRELIMILHQFQVCYAVFFLHLATLFDSGDLILYGCLGSFCHLLLTDK